VAFNPNNRLTKHLIDFGKRKSPYLARRPGKIEAMNKIHKFHPVGETQKVLSW
jgi:hypothetical protein